MRTSAKRFSIKFWFMKLTLLTVMTVLLFAGWWLWDYGDTVEVSDGKSGASVVNSLSENKTTTEPAVTSQVANTTEPTKVESTTTEPVVASVFPFSFDGKSDEDDFPGISTDLKDFDYAFAAKSSIQVGRTGIDELDTIKRDFVWEYTVDAAGKLTLSSTPITFCSDNSNCGIGNGSLEIIIKPSAASTSKVNFYITDTSDVTEFTAVGKYTKVIESYKEIEG